MSSGTFGDARQGFSTRSGHILYAKNFVKEGAAFTVLAIIRLSVLKTSYASNSCPEEYVSNSLYCSPHPDAQGETEGGIIFR